MLIPYKEKIGLPWIVSPLERRMRDRKRMKYFRCFRVSPRLSPTFFRKNSKIPRQIKQAEKSAFNTERLTTDTKKNLHRVSRQCRLELPGLNIKGFKFAMGGYWLLFYRYRVFLHHGIQAFPAIFQLIRLLPAVPVT